MDTSRTKSDVICACLQLVWWKIHLGWHWRLTCAHSTVTGWTPFRWRLAFSRSMKPEISKVTSARHAAVPVLFHITDFKHIIWPHKTFNFTVDMQLLRADWKRRDRGVHARSCITLSYGRVVTRYMRCACPVSVPLEHSSPHHRAQWWHEKRWLSSTTCSRKIASILCCAQQEHRIATNTLVDRKSNIFSGHSRGSARRNIYYVSNVDFILKKRSLASTSRASLHTFIDPPFSFRKLYLVSAVLKYFSKNWQVSRRRAVGAWSELDHSMDHKVRKVHVVFNFPKMSSHNPV